MEKTIATLLEGIPLPAVLIGRGERILGANSQARRLLGQEIVGRHFITALRQPAVLDAVEACLRDGTQRKTRFLTREGTRDATYVVTCSRVETETGNGALVCFEDTTHLEQAGQMRRDFVANVSHELRTPLTSLMGFIETLRGPARNDAAAIDRFLDIMHGESSRMERLVKDLLSLSRVEDQERIRPTQSVNLSDLLRSVCHAMKPQADERALDIVLALPDAPLVVPGDSDQLIQVFSNLVENAFKYGGDDNVVTITAWRDEHAPSVRGPAVTISVRDKGPGIEERHIPRLTERFYRVDSHRSRQMGGTGLGLAIVKHIVNRHRGRLRVSSKLGEGSEFCVTLPGGP